jgi:lysyl-tRNA synthetase class 1
MSLFSSLAGSSAVDRLLAMEAKAWPMEEARRLLARCEQVPPSKGYVLFETGYGPSGLPHLGTFAEVARTSMVRFAFEQISDIPTKLFVFSDDKDGLRKIPGNLPNQTMLQAHLGQSLTSIPDPFDTHESFGAHMNARLCAFLDQFGFDYSLESATAHYAAGRFDALLRDILVHYEAVMGIMLPSLGEERQASYSPFLPICPFTQVVLQVPMTGWDVEAGTVTYDDPGGRGPVTLPVTGGHCKLQWKVDWAMRWAALEVDYEMFGKDLIPSANLSTDIVKALGYRPPVLYQYEHFLDAEGRKISKSKGNGLSMDEWLAYAPTESLAYYLYQSPRKAKRLHWDVIPKAMDDYIAHGARYAELSPAQQLENPLYYVHHGRVPSVGDASINFSLLLQLVHLCHADRPEPLWQMLMHYDAGLSPEASPWLEAWIPFAMHYYRTKIAPYLSFPALTEEEIRILGLLAAGLEGFEGKPTAASLQQWLYDFARAEGIETGPLYQSVYRALLGQSHGPRLGTLIAIYGPSEVAAALYARIRNATAESET